MCSRAQMGPHACNTLKWNNVILATRLTPHWNNAFLFFFPLCYKCARLHAHLPEAFTEIMRFSLATNRPTHLPTLLPVCPTLYWNIKKIVGATNVPTFLPAPPHPTWIFTKIMCPPSCPPARPFTEVSEIMRFTLATNGPACLPARRSAANDRQRRNRVKRWWSTEGWTTVNDGKRQKLKAAKSRREAALKTITACRLPPACLRACRLTLPSQYMTCRVLFLLFWRILFWRLLDKENALLKWQL